MTSAKEQDAWNKKFAERSDHYMRLNFDFTSEDINDDQLWEKAKNLPIAPNNRENLDGRTAQEHLKLLIAMHEGLPGEELLKIEENLRNLRKLTREVESRKQLSKEDLLRADKGSNERTCPIRPTNPTVG